MQPTLSPDPDLQGVFDGCFRDEDEVAAAACTGDFVAERDRSVFRNHFVDIRRCHVREHRDLRFKGCRRCLTPRNGIFREQGFPDGFRCIGKGFGICRINIRSRKNVVFGAARVERHEPEAFFNPREQIGVAIRRDFGRPVALVVIEFIQARHDDSDGVLRAADVAIARHRRVLVAEKNLREFFEVAAVGDVRLPEFHGFLAGACGHAAPVVEFVVRFDGNRQNRTRRELVYERLVEPAAGEVDAVRDFAFLTQRRR